MSAGAWLALYAYVGVALVSWAAYLDKPGTREALVLLMLWPIVLLFLFVESVAKWFGWKFDMQYRRDMSIFGWRKPNGVGNVGRALRLFWLELQVWKVKK